MKKKILIVDDNTDLNRVLQMSLNESFETLSAINGEEAVDLAVTEMPDLIIMDLMMNGMNGFEAIRLIRQVPKTRSIPIIAITAGLSNTVEEECTRIGCNDFLFKPFTASQLNSSIAKLLNQNGSQRDQMGEPAATK
jgi:CheY-like chemotaxis protein